MLPWSIAQVSGIFIERMCSELYKNKLEEKLSSKFSQQNIRRILGIILSVWCFYGSLTNFYFVVGKHSFMNVFNKILDVSLVDFLVVLLANYCRVQTSISFEIES